MVIRYSPGAGLDRLVQTGFQITLLGVTTYGFNGYYSSYTGQNNYFVLDYSKLVNIIGFGTAGSNYLIPIQGELKTTCATTLCPLAQTT